MVDEVEIGRAPDCALDKRDGEMMLTILPVDKMRKLFPALFLNGVSSETGFGRTFCVFPFKVWGIWGAGSKGSSFWELWPQNSQLCSTNEMQEAASASYGLRTAAHFYMRNVAKLHAFA